MGALGLMLEADGSSIPSTAADYTPVPRETEDQRRERLAVEAGHTLTTCPECGGRATRESVLVYRTGEGTLQQTLIRCCAAPGARAARSHRGREESEMSDTNETIAEVLRLDEEATPGPWGRRSSDRDAQVRDANDQIMASVAYPQSSYANAALIAYYRTAAPALAREVQRLQAEVERLRLEHAEERLVSCCEGHDLGYDAGRRAGQEAMRERCLQACEDIILFSRSAEGIHLAADMRCMRSHLLQAIRALEVSDD
jgi:hypothetical protein